MRDNLRHLIREYVRAILSEGPVPLRKPRTEAEKLAFFDLLKWAGDMMGAGDSDITNAVAEAEHGDWTDAIDLLRTYYIMKRMPFKVEQN